MRNEEQQNVVKIKRFKYINDLAMGTNHVEHAMKIKKCTDEKLASVLRVDN